MIQHSLQAWATALGMERRTLETRMVKAGHEMKKGFKRPYQAKQIFDALLGDKDAEKNRLAAAQATKVELENAETAKQLVRLDIVEEKLWTNLLSPLRDGLLTYPKITGAKLKAVLQSRGVADDVAKEAVEVAAAGVSEIVEMIKPKP